MSRKTLEDYKIELVGNTYGWLTVLDVYKTNFNKRICLCKCRCGVEKEIDLVKIVSGHTKSCGCYKKSAEFSKKISQWYEDNPEKVAEKSKKFSQWCKENTDRTKQWGEKYSEWRKNNLDKVAEANEKHKQWFKDNPDKVAERSAKFSQWCKDNPDKVREIGKARSKYLREHPEELAKIASTIRCWHKDNPDKAKEKAERYSQWCKENKDILREKGKRFSKFCKENPSFTNKLGEKISNYYINNPDKARLAGKRISDARKRDRINSDMSLLVEIIHPMHIDELLSGKLNSGSIIKTKCPKCGNYDSHTLGNVFMINKSALKMGRPPLCKQCKYILTSSSYEQEIADYISTFYKGECIRNNRSILSGKELDLYYPEKKLAIEFNGDYWHDENHKPRDYHYNKFKDCLNSCIILVSIFESEWKLKKIHIKNYLKDLFNGKDNSLSFNDDHTLMNNNFPLANFSVIDNESYIDDYYINANSIVYTCGFSYIKNNSRI